MTPRDAVMIRKMIAINTAILGAIITWTGGVFALYYGGGIAAPAFCFSASLILMALPHSQLRDGWVRQFMELFSGAPEVPYYSELSDTYPEEVNVDV